MTFNDTLRTQFTETLSKMYREEVPQYASLCSLVDSINKLKSNSNKFEQYEKHGAIRLGSATELSMVRRLFAVMGMYPVDYYDLSVAGIPVHSTAFRPISSNSLDNNPFRMFTSLLRLDLVKDKKLRVITDKLLSKRNIISSTLKQLIEIYEKQGYLNSEQTKQFIKESILVFNWHQDAQVDSETYQMLNSTHRLLSDIVSFKGPHINHLTRNCIDIDELQSQLLAHGFDAKETVEGPPKRKYPILLRQTSFLALEEKIIFKDGIKGTHTARFGEVEQRGVALTPKGRALYDSLLNKAQKARGESDSRTVSTQSLEEVFRKFPDNQHELHNQKLAYYQYTVIPDAQINFKLANLKQLLDHHILEITPILYEDFLPVSAAGIFSSNLENADKNSSTRNTDNKQSPNQSSFEKALGCSVMNSFSLYETIQKDSLNAALTSLGIKPVL